MPTNRIIYAVSLAVAVLVVGLTGSGFVLLYALAALVAASLILVRFAPYIIRINENIEKKELCKNETISYMIGTPQSAFFLFPRIRYSFYSEGRVSYAKSAEGEYALSFPYRGYYPVGISGFHVMDCLGLLTRVFARRKPIYVTVFPKSIENFVFPLQNELVSGDTAGVDLHSERGQDRFDVRKYAYGDDYRKIHWKLTAKKNELIVKDYNASVLSKTLVFLDTAAIPDDSENPLKAQDDMTSIVVSAAMYCVRNKMQAFVFFGENSAEIRNSADYELLLRQMARVTFNDEEYLPSMLREYAQDENLFSIVLVVYRIGGDLFLRINELAMLGHNVIVYTIGAETAEEREHRAVLTASGVVCQVCAEMGWFA